MSTPGHDSVGGFFYWKQKAEVAEAKVSEWRDMAYRERDRADEHDSARQSEKERADYAEAKLAEAQDCCHGVDCCTKKKARLEAELAEAQEETARIRAFLGDASPKS